MNYLLQDSESVQPRQIKRIKRNRGYANRGFAIYFPSFSFQDVHTRSRETFIAIAPKIPHLNHVTDDLRISRLILC